MATLFLAETKDGRQVFGMVVTADDLGALGEGHTILVDLSPTAQETLHTAADAFVLLPCEEQEAVDLAKRMPEHIIVNERKPH